MNVYRSKTLCFDGVAGQPGEGRGGRSLSLGDVSDVLSLKWFILGRTAFEADSSVGPRQDALGTHCLKTVAVEELYGSCERYGTVDWEEALETSDFDRVLS